MSERQLCPKCNGQRIVNVPPWVPGDQAEWTSNTTGPYECGLCHGEGTIGGPTE